MPRFIVPDAAQSHPFGSTKTLAISWYSKHNRSPKARLVQSFRLYRRQTQRRSVQRFFDIEYARIGVPCAPICSNSEEPSPDRKA